ncbi:transposase [Paenibacillus puerhi]|uniref:transposase n=1 Tax=Paenibacillus puerhi TaxID=2692622 RepID=UPI00135B26E2|nr:transposase [Paenibacillus puerhi]
MEKNAMDFDYFRRFYADEAACENTLFSAKWPNGFTCSLCGHQHAYRIRTRRLPLFECRHCAFQESLIAGTVMEGSKTALSKWFMAIFLVSDTSCSINARQLSSIIEVTYKTAWLILHKLRHAITLSNDQKLLAGIVRVNVASYGRPRYCSSVQHPRQQLLFIGAALDDSGDPVHLKIKKVPAEHSNGNSVRSSGKEHFNKSCISPRQTESEFVTAPFSPKRFRDLHAIALIAGSWLNRTFHGIGPKHLQAYLEEFTYRYMLSRSDRSPFSSLLNLMAASPRTTYFRIVHPGFFSTGMASPAG